MKRKATALLLLTAMAVLCLSLFPAYAEEGGEQEVTPAVSGLLDGVGWSLDENGILSIFGTGAVPDFSPGYFAPWYDYRLDISLISIGEGITSIGDYAFLNCENVAVVSLPQGVSEVGIQAFANCASLGAIVLPDTVRSIGAYAFANCFSLRSAEFLGDAPTFGQNCFSGVTSAIYAHCTRNGWSDEIMLPYGGSLSWSYHAYDEGTVLTPADCLKDGCREVHCAQCGETKLEPILSRGHQIKHVKRKDPDCLHDGNIEHWYCSVCNAVWMDEACTENISLNDTVLKGEHVPARDEAVPPTADLPGKTEGSHCERCGEIFVPQENIPPLGHTVHFSNLGYGTDVMIDADVYSVNSEGNITLPSECGSAGVVLNYITGYESESFSNFPTGMSVYSFTWDENGNAVASEIPTLRNVLRYGGVSIRSVGKIGIRLFTSIPAETFNNLATGSSGYRLVDFGTVVAFQSALSGGLRLSAPGVTEIPAQYEEITEETITCCGEFTGLVDGNCAETIVMRPYLRLLSPEGEKIVLYGGMVARSVGYVAWQNRYAYPEGTEKYERIWSFIHAQYGNRYDSEYR